MIKVIFKSGREANFHGSQYTHNAEHNMFFIEDPYKHRIMIPDDAVECIGIWDKEKDEFA